MNDKINLTEEVKIELKEFTGFDISSITIDEAKEIILCELCRKPIFIDDLALHWETDCNFFKGRY